MSVPTLPELFVGKTTEQVLASMLQVGGQLGFPITAWESDDAGREMLFIFASQVSNYSELGSIAAGGGLLDYASGAWLTLLAFQLYDVTRIEATFGTCTVRLTNSGDVQYVIQPGEARFFLETGTHAGATYTNTTGGTLNAGSTLDLVVQADEAGTDSNAPVGTITGMVTPILEVTAVNTTPLVATDTETDPALRTRCKESLAKASPNGPSDAYSYYAKSTVRSDGSNVGITRVSTVDGDGSVVVYIANSAGEVEDADVDLVDASIQANVVPTGITASVVSAIPLDVDIQAMVYLAQGATLSPLQVKQAILAQLTTYFEQVPIGGYNIGTGGKVFLEAVVGQIFQAAPGQILQVVITVPLVDVDVEPEEVAVLISEVSSFTVIQS
jgi:uncharacterized phage protein gp47/JayE